MRTRRLASIFCVALLVFGVGCRDRSTAQDKQDKLCAELGEMDGTVAQIAAVDPSTGSVAQIRALRTRLEAQYRDVQEAAKDADAVRMEPVNQAYNKVLRSINGVNDQGSLAQAEAGIDEAAGEFSTARLEVHTNARCA